jgi:hypothetical protein
LQRSEVLHRDDDIVRPAYGGHGPVLSLFCGDYLCCVWLGEIEFGFLICDTLYRYIGAVVVGFVVLFVFWETVRSILHVRESESTPPGSGNVREKCYFCVLLQSVTQLPSL